MWKSAYVGVYQLLNWKMHSETLKYHESIMAFVIQCSYIWLIRVKEGGGCTDIWETWILRMKSS
jgi:hypothetical protein